MKVPSRVRIIKNVLEAGNEYYEKFVGQEHDVIDSDSSEITLKIPNESGSETHTIWYEDEYEVLEWDESEVEMVTISKAEYDELLEFRNMYEGVSM